MQVTPYLIFDGNCEEALNFYAKVLGGNVSGLMRYKDAPGENRMGMAGDKIIHSHVNVGGDVLLMASDGPGGGQGTASAHLSLNFTDPESIKAAYEGIQEGGKVNMPLQDTFWGATFGMVTDKYGVNWMFNYDKPKNN